MDYHAYRSMKRFIGASMSTNGQRCRAKTDDNNLETSFVKYQSGLSGDLFERKRIYNESCLNERSSVISYWFVRSYQSE